MDRLPKSVKDASNESGFQSLSKRGGPHFNNHTRVGYTVACFNKTVNIFVNYRIIHIN